MELFPLVRAPPVGNRLLHLINQYPIVSRSAQSRGFGVSGPQGEDERNNPHYQSGRGGDGCRDSRGMWECPLYHETLESPNANQSARLLEHLAERQRFEESIQILARLNAGKFKGKVAATSSKQSLALRC